MNASSLKDLLQTANEAQSIMHSVSLMLKEITGVPSAHYLIVIAAAAENATDKASMIIENAREVD